MQGFERRGLREVERYVALPDTSGMRRVGRQSGQALLFSARARLKRGADAAVEVTASLLAPLVRWAARHQRMSNSPDSLDIPDAAPLNWQHSLYGVGVLGAQVDYRTQSTQLHLLYAGSEVNQWDAWSGENREISGSGAGLTVMSIPGCLAGVEILRACGDATDGKYRHIVLPDGSHARELRVRDFYVRILAEA